MNISQQQLILPSATLLTHHWCSYNNMQRTNICSSSGDGVVAAIVDHYRWCRPCSLPYWGVAGVYLVSNKDLTWKILSWISVDVIPKTAARDKGVGKLAEFMTHSPVCTIVKVNERIETLARNCPTHESKVNVVDVLHGLKNKKNSRIMKIATKTGKTHQRHASPKTLEVIMWCEALDGTRRKSKNLSTKRKLTPYIFYVSWIATMSRTANDFQKGSKTYIKNLLRKKIRFGTWTSSIKYRKPI